MAAVVIDLVSRDGVACQLLNLSAPAGKELGSSRLSYCRIHLFGTRQIPIFFGYSFAILRSSQSSSATLIVAR